LTIAEKISATGVVLHTGSHKGLGIDAVTGQVITALTEILAQTPSDTKLALENMAGQGGVIGASFEELGMLITGVGSDRLGVCFDTCHAFAAGYDISNSEGVDSTMKEFDAAVGFDKLLVVHANDSLMELGGNRDRHENIGQGFIGDDGFRALLSHPTFEGVPFLLEVPGEPTEDSKKGTPSKVGWLSSALKPSSPINPCPIFSCLSLFPPNSISESFACTTSNLSNPTAASNSFMVLSTPSELLMSYPAAKA
jgi:apurinic endonuclease APN1